MDNGTATTLDATTRITNPHDLVKEEDVQKALLADKGPKAVLQEFNIKDFTKKGDNFACIVTSVFVQYEKDGRKQETSYVVKLNPCRDGMLNVMLGYAFKKETLFYTTILPLLNKELEQIKEPKLRVPAHFHSVETTDEQVIYLEDLRVLGYKMFDRKKSMDRAHTDLILCELARLHASSALMIAHPQFKGPQLLERFPMLRDPFVQSQTPTEEKNDTEEFVIPVEQIFTGMMETAAKIAESFEEYKPLAEKLRANFLDVGKELNTQTVIEERFKIICHGDCWNNNFLFRYSASGIPLDCRLLDLQGIKVDSVSGDINMMLYIGLASKFRQTELFAFLKSYYASFASVMAAAHRTMPFTLPQLKKEYHSRNNIGLCMAMIVVPPILLDSEDAPELEQLLGLTEGKENEKYSKTLIESLKKNPMLRPRFLDILDEIKESGSLQPAKVSKLIENFNKMNNK